MPIKYIQAILKYFKIILDYFNVNRDQCLTQNRIIVIMAIPSAPFSAQQQNYFKLSLTLKSHAKHVKLADGRHGDDVT